MSVGDDALEILSATSPHTLGSIARVFSNILANPDEPKYNKLRVSNPAIAAILDADGARELLLIFGFVQEGDFLVLPSGPPRAAAAALGDRVIAAAVSAEVFAAPSAAAPSPARPTATTAPPAVLSPERVAELARLDKERAAKAAEFARLKAQAKADQEERKAEQACRVIKPSHATARGAGEIRKFEPSAGGGGG